MLGQACYWTKSLAGWRYWVTQSRSLSFSLSFYLSFFLQKHLYNLSSLTLCHYFPIAILASCLAVSETSRKKETWRPIVHFVCFVGRRNQYLYTTEPRFLGISGQIRAKQQHLFLVAQGDPWQAIREVEQAPIKKSENTAFLNIGFILSQFCDFGQVTKHLQIPGLSIINMR